MLTGIKNWSGPERSHRDEWRGHVHRQKLTGVKVQKSWFVMLADTGTPLNDRSSWAMNVKEVMVDKVSTGNLDTPLDSIALTMWNNDCGCVPIVDEQSKPVGMVTDRDIAIGAALQHKPLWEIRARDITNSRPVYKCKSEDDVHQALQLMREHGVRRLPVVNRQGKLAGIVSSGDLIACADTSASAQFPFAETADMLKAVTGHHQQIQLSAG